MLNETPLITVIVPNFNHGHLIGNCIDALLNQDFRNFEVVIIDDNSTDNSVQIIEKKILSDKRFKLICLERNLGVLEVQNMAIEKVNSKFLYLAAADDYILPNFFSSLVEILEDNTEIAFAGKKGLIPVTNKPLTFISRPIFVPYKNLSIFAPKDASKQLVNTDFLYITGACLIRTDMFKSIGNLKLDLGAFADGIHLRKLAVRFGYAFINDFGMVWRRVNSGFSVSELNGNSELDLKLNKIVNLISEDSNFEAGYANLLVRRIKFMSNVNKIFSKSNSSDRFLRKYLNTFYVYFLIFMFILKLRPFPIASLIKLLYSNRSFKYQRVGLFE